MNKIDAILLDLGNSAEINLLIISDDLELKRELKKILIKNPEGVSKTIFFNVKTKLEFKKLLGKKNSEFYVLYDPSNLITPTSRGLGKG